jgi:hypothetical protein
MPSTSRRVWLAHINIDEKPNEIPAAVPYRHCAGADPLGVGS